MSSSSSSPVRNSFDKGGRLYGSSASASTIVRVPSKPAARSASAARVPAIPAPTTTMRFPAVMPGSRVLGAESFDVFVAAGVLEHVRVDVGAAGEVARGILVQRGVAARPGVYDLPPVSVAVGEVERVGAVLVE